MSVHDLFARHLRANQTDAEKRLWAWLRDFKQRGFHFRRQVKIGAYVADFATLGANLIASLMAASMARRGPQSTMRHGRNFRTRRVLP